MGTHAAPTAAERFLERIRPKRRSERVTEDADFCKMMMRMVRAMELRAIERPENLLQILAVVQRMNEVVNVAIAINAARYAQDPYSAASMAECAKALGISKPSASARRQIGDRIIAERLAANNVTRIDTRGRQYEVSPEVARETEAIERAAEAAEVAFVDFLARRRAA